MKKKDRSPLDFSGSKIYSRIKIDGQIVGVIGNEHNRDRDWEFVQHIAEVSHIHDFVNYITSGEFEIGSSRYQGRRSSKDLIQKKLAMYFDRFSDMVSEQEFKRPVRYSEQVELFWDQSNQYLTSKEDLFNVSVIDRFNEIITRIMEATRRPDYRRRLDSRRKSVLQNYQSVSSYVSSLFRSHASLHIVRIDLLTSLFPSQEPVGIEKAHELLESFVKDSHRHALFKNVVGYIWKLEFSEFKGSYFHFILLLEKSDLLLTNSIAEKFGKFWVESVTKNLGGFSISTKDVILRRSWVTGVLDAIDVDALRRLSEELEYLMVKDFYMLPNIFVKDGKRRNRTYGRSLRG